MSWSINLLTPGAPEHWTLPLEKVIRQPVLTGLQSPLWLLNCGFYSFFFFCLIPSSGFITDLRQTTTKYRFTRWMRVQITFFTLTALLSQSICLTICLPTFRSTWRNTHSLLADAADKAVWVVRSPQRRHHLSGDVLVTAVTLGPVEPLVVLCTDVLTRMVEETRMHQVTAAH